jgi:hypothetical protein
MTQTDFGTINPTTKSGTDLAADLNAWRDTIHTAHKGASRPSYAVASMFWCKDVSASVQELYYYDGSDDILVLSLDLTNNAVSFAVADGSVTAPGLFNNGDANTGIYWPAADEMALALGGARIAHLKSTGVGIGDFTPAGTNYFEVRKDQNAATISRLTNSNAGAAAEARVELATGTATSTLALALHDNAAAPYAALTIGAAVTHFQISAALKIAQRASFSGVISPTQITSNQNDYNPTSLSTSSVLRLDSDAARDITGIAGGEAGRVLFLHYIGSTSITLKDASGSSSAANRFANGADITLTPTNPFAIASYDATSSRWRTTGGGGVAINSLTEDTSPDLGADYVMTYDASASAHKKVKAINLTPLTVGGVGTYGFFYYDADSSAHSPGFTCPAADLNWAGTNYCPTDGGINAAALGSAPSTGTWQLMGYAANTGGGCDPNNFSLSLWLRIV